MVQLQPRSAISQNTSNQHPSPPPPYQSLGLNNRISPQPSMRPQTRYTTNYQPRPNNRVSPNPNHPPNTNYRPPPSRIRPHANYLVRSSEGQMVPKVQLPRPKVQLPSPYYNGKGNNYPVKPRQPSQMATHGKNQALTLAPLEITKKYENIKANIKQLENSKVVQKHIGRYQIIKAEVKRQIKKHPYITGTLLTMFSLILFFNQNNFIRMGINKISVLDNHGFFTKYGLFTELAWANPPVYGRACLYFFAIKNGEEFLQGAKPHLEEVGPFCIYATRRRNILEWKNKTVKFEERYILGVDPRGSLPLETTWRTINLPIFVAVYTVRSFMNFFYLRYLGPIVYNAIVKALTMTGEDLITDMTAYQILVRYEVKILQYLDMFLLKPLRSIGLPIPDELGILGLKLTNATFGITTTASSGWLGPFEMYHTTEDGHMVGDIYSALNFKKFPLIAPPCNVMKGGEGYFWKRPITDEKLTIFFYFICRLLVLKKEFSHYFYGSYVTRYKLDEDMFDYSTPENACHCVKEDIRDCKGWHAFSPCIFMVPVGITLAHFYKSPKQLATVVGLNPDKEKHDCYLEIESQLGFPVYVHLAPQLVLDMEPISYVPELANVPKMQYPIAWVKVKIGAIGILGGFLFILVTLIHYGNILWLALGLAGTAYLFRKAKDWRNTP